MRCVRRNEQDLCVLWHRQVAGRAEHFVPKDLEACAYYRPLLLKIALDFAHRELPLPELVVQLARLWVMVLVQQKGLCKEFAKEEIARRTMIPIAHFKVAAYCNYLTLR